MGTAFFKFLLIVLIVIYEITVVLCLTHKYKYFAAKKVEKRKSDEATRESNVDAKPRYQQHYLGRKPGTIGSVSNLQRERDFRKHPGSFQRLSANERNDFLNKFEGAKLYENTAFIHKVPGFFSKRKRSRRLKRRTGLGDDDYNDSYHSLSSGEDENDGNREPRIKEDDEADLGASGDFRRYENEYFQKPEEPEENAISIDFQYSGSNEHTASIRPEFVDNIQEENPPEEKFEGGRTIEEMEGEPSSVIENFFSPNDQEKAIIQRELLRPQIQKFVSDEVGGNSLITLLSQVATIL